LSLEDTRAGPLVIPGPHSVDIQVNNDNASHPRFVYADKWPQLNDTLLANAQESQSIRLRHLVAELDQALLQVQPEIRYDRRSRLTYLIFQMTAKTTLLVRTRLECRLTLRKAEICLNHGLPLVTNIQSAPVHQVPPEAAAALLLTSHIHSATLLLFSLRVMSSPERAVSETMIALGVLALLDSRNLLGLLDESVWRALFLGYSDRGGVLMRHVTSVCYDALLSTGASADAFTYSVVARCLSSTDTGAQTEGTAGLSRDAYFFLEELGVSWLIERLWSPAFHSKKVSGVNLSTGKSNRPESWVSTLQQYRNRGGGNFETENRARHAEKHKQIIESVEKVLSQLGVDSSTTLVALSNPHPYSPWRPHQVAPFPSRGAPTQKVSMSFSLSGGDDNDLEEAMLRRVHRHRANSRASLDRGGLINGIETSGNWITESFGEASSTVQSSAATKGCGDAFGIRWFFPSPAQMDKSAVSPPRTNSSSGLRYGTSS